MQFPKDHEYFIDISEDGYLLETAPDGSPTVSEVFLRTTTQESLGEKSFKVHSFFGEDGLRREAEYRIRRITNGIWWKCIGDAKIRERRRIGRFPRAWYSLYTLKGEQDDAIWDVAVDCMEKIESAGYQQLSDLDDLIQDYHNGLPMRAALKKAAILAVINLILCLIYALSQVFALPGHSLSFLLGVPILAVFAAAVYTHREKALNPFFDAFVVMGCVAVPFAVQFGKSDETETQAMLLLMVALAAWYCLLYILHFILSCKPEKKYRKALKQLDPGIHKEIRFMQLWYKHMTGDFCAHLQQVEDKLLYYLDLREQGK